MSLLAPGPAAPSWAVRPHAWNVPGSRPGHHDLSDDAPATAERAALADYLGCNEEARGAAWAAWSAELNSTDWDEAEYWLDVEFVEPCPEHTK